MFSASHIVIKATYTWNETHDMFRFRLAFSWKERQFSETGNTIGVFWWGPITFSPFLMDLRTFLVLKPLDTAVSSHQQDIHIHLHLRIHKYFSLWRWCGQMEMI